MSKRKAGSGKGKGSGFEREICVILSKWWTAGLSTPRSDVFWRSTLSGGRATVRSRKGQPTSGNYGDVQPIDPDGKRLMDWCVFEVKKGYKSLSLGDLLDATDRMKPLWHQWIRQAMDSAEQAGSYGWALVFGRDYRKPIIVFPSYVYSGLVDCSCVASICPRFQVQIMFQKHRRKIVAFCLDDFLRVVRREHIERFLDTEYD